MQRKQLIELIERDHAQGIRRTWVEYAVLAGEPSPERVRHWWRRHALKNNISAPAKIQQEKVKVNTSSKEYKTLSESKDIISGDAVLRGYITSQQQAIEFFQIDTSVWEVIEFTCTSWTIIANGAPCQQTHIKLKCRRKDTSVEETVFEIKKALETYTKERYLASRKTSGDKVGVVSCADFHIGATIKELIRTPEFNVNVVIDYLNQIADKVNDMQFSEVHLNLLGDYVESISGLNHMSTFKSIDNSLVGANVIKVCYELLTNHLISRINNLKSVNLVSGNHDRFTISKDVDNEGYTGELLAWMLSREFSNLEVNFNPMLLTRHIDGICYILTHGHYNLSKKHSMETILKYGDPKKFNILLEGHTHSRRQMKTTKTVVHSYNDVHLVEMDDINFRKVVVPAIFTGNYYSEGLGFTTNAGFMVVESNGKGKPNVYDFTISI